MRGARLPTDRTPQWSDSGEWTQGTPLRVHERGNLEEGTREREGVREGGSEGVREEEEEGTREGESKGERKGGREGERERERE